MNLTAKQGYRIVVSSGTLGLSAVLWEVFLERYSTVPDDAIKHGVELIYHYAGLGLLAFSIVSGIMMALFWPAFRSYFKAHFMDQFSVGDVEAQDEREQLVKYQAGYETLLILVSILFLIFIYSYVVLDSLAVGLSAMMLVVLSSGIYYFKLMAKGVDIVAQYKKKKKQ